MTLPSDHSTEAETPAPTNGSKLPSRYRLRSFSDDFAITITDDQSDPHEQRFVAVGIGDKGRLLVVVYAYRGEDFAFISARPADPHESRQHEAER